MISLSKEAAIALGACMAAVLVPVLVFMFVRFPLKMSQDEMTLLAFNPLPLNLTTRKWKERDAPCPVAAAASTGTAKAEESDSAKAVLTEPDPLLSFILYGGTNGDIAILDGHLLHKGQRLKNMRVVKIEQKRVQIADRKGKRWLTME